MFIQAFQIFLGESLSWFPYTLNVGELAVLTAQSGIEWGITDTPNWDLTNVALNPCYGRSAGTSSNIISGSLANCTNGILGDYVQLSPASTENATIGVSLGAYYDIACIAVELPANCRLRNFSLQVGPQGGGWKTIICRQGLFRQAGKTFVYVGLPRQPDSKLTLKRGRDLWCLSWGAINHRGTTTVKGTFGETAGAPISNSLFTTVRNRLLLSTPQFNRLESLISPVMSSRDWIAKASKNIGDIYSPSHLAGTCVNATCSFLCTDDCSSFCWKSCVSGCDTTCSITCQDSCTTRCYANCTNGCSLSTCTATCGTSCTQSCGTTCTQTCRAVGCSVTCGAACQGGCSAACAGGCHGTCASGCWNNVCTSTCWGYCKNNCYSIFTAYCGSTCSYTCETGCTHACGTTCSHSCGSSGCSYSCGSSCATRCGAACDNACKGACAVACHGVCAGGCTAACTGACSSTCSQTCRDNCTTNCRTACYSACAQTVCGEVCSQGCNFSCGSNLCATACNLTCGGLVTYAPEDNPYVSMERATTDGIERSIVGASNRDATIL